MKEPSARFGPFELNLTTGELRKHGIKVRLQAKQLEVLKALIERPGHLVSREELHRRLWNDETFVDFENGLNTAINRLRLSLGDSADQPRYVETLARAGYRFIAPLERNPAPQEMPVPVETAPIVWKSTLVRRSMAAVLLLMGALAGFLYARLTRPPEANVRQLTFRRGQVWSARFGPDGQTVFYTAQWEREPRQLFQNTPGSPESRALGFSGMTAVSISRRGEVALLEFGGTMNISGGVLKRAPLNGGAPLEIDRGINAADFSPDGSSLAVIRAIHGANHLEYPVGQTLCKTAGWMSTPRVSPDGQAVVFIEHPVRHDDQGKVVLYRHGECRTVSADWANVVGLAWHPSGKEIWFTAGRKGASRSLWAVTPDGRLRAVAQAPGILTLRDISPTGKVLVSRESRRLEMAGMLGGATEERSYSWLDWSRVQSLSADGGLLLFDESGEGTAGEYNVYLHRAGDGSTIRVCEGKALSLSADGKWVLTLSPTERGHLRLVSLEGEPPRDLPANGIEYQWARLFAGERVLALASYPRQPLRLFVHALRGGTPVPITPEMVVRNVAVSPDGEQVALLTADGRLMIYPTRPGEPRAMPAAEPLAPIHWSRDGRHLFVQHLRSHTGLPARVSRLDVRDGALETWKELAPSDPMGVTDVTGVALSADERSYVYSYRRILAELFLINGWN